MSSFPTFHDLTQFEAGEYGHDWHAAVTMPLGELIEAGWVNWFNEDGTPNKDWVWDYYDLEQYSRVCNKFNNRFFWDEISMLPPIKWKQQLIRKFNEIMPKYKPLYEIIGKGYDPLQIFGEYGKSRNIYSEFPETLLNGNSDYVSNGTDREYEIIKQGDWLDRVLRYAKEYNDIDALILDELESMFSGLYAVSVNGF